MKNVGTLKELDVKPGDVVAYDKTGAKYVVSDEFESLINDDGESCRHYGWNTNSCFRIVSRASDNPKI